MTYKKFPSFFSTIFLLLPLLFLAVSAQTQSSPFDTLEKLQGCQKGDKIKGIHDLKLYLKKYGYLTTNPSSPSNQVIADNDDYFDDITESAIKTYQLNHNLQVTGRLDTKTLSMMMTPRCGVPDIINGRTIMNSCKKIHQHGLGLNNSGSYFKIHPENPKWTKFQLTYAFKTGTREDAVNPIALALSQWASVTNFTFMQVNDFANADIKISFEKGDHGDSGPFDGPGGILAHADPPTGGLVHLDGDENWVVGVVVDGYDMGTVGMHELGHTLGLDHSSVEAAVMWPYIGTNLTKGLNADDIQGIHALYA